MRSTMNNSPTRGQSRAGLRIRGGRGNDEVRKALVQFARWLRLQHEFPIRVPVYLHPEAHIVTMRGEKGSASFFAPWDRKVEPYIRIATGDYGALRAKVGRDDALAAFIASLLAHEVLHYQQWTRTGRVHERGVIR